LGGAIDGQVGVTVWKPFGMPSNFLGFDFRFAVLRFGGIEVKLSANSALANIS
jgi:hypothetical protein